jgi:hypothetical protein
MSLNYRPEHLERFLSMLTVVSKEAILLAETRKRLFGPANIDAAWINGLSTNDYWGDVLEAFTSRFGRMLDNLGDKLLPSLALLEGERPGSAINNYNKAEQRGLIRSAEDWMTMRTLRNRLVHEYLNDVNEFVDSLHLAKTLTDDLLLAYKNIRHYAEHHLQIAPDKLPPQLGIIS